MSNVFRRYKFAYKSSLDAEEIKKHPRLKNFEPDKTLKNHRNCQ